MQPWLYRDVVPEWVFLLGAAFWCNLSLYRDVVPVRVVSARGSILVQPGGRMDLGLCRDVVPVRGFLLGASFW